VLILTAKSFWPMTRRTTDTPPLSDVDPEWWEDDRERFEALKAKGEDVVVLWPAN
jgi:hypothetical protein